MKFSMKNRAYVVAFLAVFVAAGCHPGGDPGDPDVGAKPGRPAATLEQPVGRPGTPNGPALKPPPPKDPYGGRTGAAAGQ